MSHDVFISYATVDKLTADAVCGTLESRGIRCWIAPRDISPGQDWSDAIIDGLTSTRVFVLLLSATSNKSEQVKREVQNAVSEGMAIVPFRLEDVALSKHMRYFIGTPHWLDALTPPMEAHLERLSKTIHALLQVTESAQIETLQFEAGQPVAASLMASVAPAENVKSDESFKEEWNPEDLRKIERELAGFIGPVARVLVHKAAIKTIEPSVLCAQVSLYVSNEAERKRFLEVTSRLFPAPDVANGNSDTAVSATPVVPKTWDPTVLQKIEQQFAVHIGPLSRVLVKRASQRAGDLDEMYRLLAEHLTSTKDKESFLRSRPAV